MSKNLFDKLFKRALDTFTGLGTGFDKKHSMSACKLQTLLPSDNSILLNLIYCIYTNFKWKLLYQFCSQQAFLQHLSGCNKCPLPATNDPSFQRNSGSKHHIQELFPDLNLYPLLSIILQYHLKNKPPR
jgi:hypothetical protein